MLARSLLSSGMSPIGPARAVERTWSAVRFGTGMAILSVVFVLSHGLLLVHELTQGASSTETA